MIRRLSTIFSIFFISATANLFAGDGQDVKEFADFTFFSQYKSFEISKVLDSTGKDMKVKVLEKVRDSLRQAMKNANLPVVMTGETADSEKTLLVEPKLIKFSGGLGSMMGMMEMVGNGDSVEGTGVTIFARFSDKKLGVELGTVKVSRGGFTKDGNLDKASEGIVDVIKKKMYTEEGKKAPMIPIAYKGGGSNRRSSAITIAQNSNIAVISISTKSESTAEAAPIVSELLRTEVVNLGIGYYNVLDREYVDKVMQEHVFAASGVTSSEGAAEIGKMLNAQKVITGSLSKMGDSYFLNVSMIDVETGKIVSAGSGDYKSQDEMKQTIQSVANRLIHLN